MSSLWSHVPLVKHCKHLGSHGCPLCAGSPRSGQSLDLSGRGSWREGGEEGGRRGGREGGEGREVSYQTWQRGVVSYCISLQVDPVWFAEAPGATDTHRAPWSKGLLFGIFLDDSLGEGRLDLVPETLEGQHERKVL